MCQACGGTCGTSALRCRARLTVDVNLKGRTLRLRDAGGPASLFVSRTLDLVCAAALAAWARRHGFRDIVPENEMHVTVAYSKAAVDWFKFPSWYATDLLQVEAGGPRRIELFKDNVAGLRFQSEALSARWAEFKAGGCSWDWPDYAPHITIAGDADDVDVSTLKAYTGQLRFGPEEFSPVQS